MSDLLSQQLLVPRDIQRKMKHVMNRMRFMFQYNQSAVIDSKDQDVELLPENKARRNTNTFYMHNWCKKILEW